jgi:uncharacterized glyoxalase superfamily metalloenzyme YdcJ
MNTPVMRNKMGRPTGWALGLWLCALLCCFALAQPTHARARDGSGASAAFDRFTDTKATMRHWKQARDYERQMRYELARQHYLLALASCRSTSAQTQLQRELESVDLQIRTMR